MLFFSNYCLELGSGYKPSQLDFQLDISGGISLSKRYINNVL